MGPSEKTAGKGSLGFKVKWIFLTVVLVGAAGVLEDVVELVYPHRHRPRNKSSCQNNLKHIGYELALLEFGNKLKNSNGASFLLQVADRFSDEDLEVFLCPGSPTQFVEIGSSEFVALYREDWRTAPCSYWGPDDARRFGERIPAIIAACIYHEDGVTVLWNHTKVGFIEWMDIQGSNGEPVPLGPDCPDPRFRHLVR